MAAKTVLITGASSGFGRAAALRFREAGWRVAATMMHTDEWKEAETDDLLVLRLNVRMCNRSKTQSIEPLSASARLTAS